MMRSLVRFTLAALVLCALNAIVAITQPAFAQLCTPPPSGLVAWYPGDGNAEDFSSTRNNAMLVGNAMFAPGKTPPEIIERLARAVDATMKRPDVRDGLQRAAFEPQSSTPQELAAFLKDQLNAWGRVAREAGLQAH